MGDSGEILTLVKDILETVFKLDRDTLEPQKDLFKDLDLDSLDAIDMAAELGSRTGTKFSNDDLRNIHTIEDVVNAIVIRQSEKH
jgi:acyl carrier protein